MANRRKVGFLLLAVVLASLLASTVLIAPAAPVGELVSTTEDPNETSYGAQRKIVRLSDGALYCVYYKQLSGYYQVYVKKSRCLAWKSHRVHLLLSGLVR